MFVVLGLLYFPASMGFRVEPKRCALTFDLPLAVQSLSNYGHIVSFFIFFLLTTAQFRSPGWRSLGWSLLVTMAMGVAVEIAEGLSGAHNCKTLDLIPDLIGAMLGLLVVVLGRTITGNVENGTCEANQPTD